eukprot:c9683_g1_i1.p1 GENE.c9683_g1_i1~~c9683_g1_i1.p1  ORF type:complete len:159 (-),score=31.30 c9683_g1_i1:20-496(-)
MGEGLENSIFMISRLSSERVALIAVSIALLFGLIVLGAIAENVLTVHGLAASNRSEGNFLVATAVLNMMWCLALLAVTYFVDFADNNTFRLLSLAAAALLALFWFVSFSVGIDLSSYFSDQINQMRSNHSQDEDHIHSLQHARDAAIAATGTCLMCLW